MRLLHARSLKFQDFNESSLPPYAILSHTWNQSQEITLQDMTSPYLPTKKGYRKITETCRLALTQGLEYAWIDTCCIDKTSSAELTESINSMFRWYQKARVCYIHLSDFHSTSVSPDLNQCVWLTRGWTLQELIAPPTLEFYNSSWEMIGTKTQLQESLSAITGIPISAISGTRPLRSFCVAEKMSWASSRRTTRTEDVAYCLLGLFDVYMPLIYGEGTRAFYRLQEEIARRTDDLTLFAWTPPESAPEYCSLLASSPAEFGQCGYMDSFSYSNARYAITNKGVKVTAHLLLQPVTSAHAGGGPVYRYILPVGYRVADGGNGVVATHISIYLWKLGPNRFIRETTQRSTRPPLHEVSVEDLTENQLRSTAMETFYLPVTIDPSTVTYGPRDPDSYVYVPHYSDIQMDVRYSPIHWNARTRMCYWPQAYNDVIALSFIARSGRGWVPFCLLFDFRGGPTCPGCILINQASPNNRLFYLLLKRAQIDPMKWEDIEYNLPGVHRLKNSLQINLGGTLREITASVEKRCHGVDEKAMDRPTLYMAIRDAPPGADNPESEGMDTAEEPFPARTED